MIVKGISASTFKRTGLFSLIVLIIFIGVAFLAVGAFLDYHQNPKFCGTTCHVMEPYYESYIDPKNNAIMQAHVSNNITCLDCHTGPGLVGQIDPWLSVPKETYSLVTGDYDPDNLHGFVPVRNCMKGCHDRMDWLITASMGRGANFTIVNGSTVWPTQQIWHPFTSNGTDFTLLLDRETCVDCHDQRLNGIGFTRDACPVCHDLTVEELNLHRDQTCGMEDCHTQPEFVGHRKVMDNCMFCHDRQHPEDARVPYSVAHEHGIFEVNSTFCSACHVENYNIFIGSESKHGSDTGCPDCHEEHKQHPQCMNCHEEVGVNHTITPPYDDCQVCHVQGGHDPFTIPFDTPLVTNDFCGECHSLEFNIFTHSLAKHSLDQNCSDCHTEHLAKPTCGKCHDSSNIDHPIQPPYDDCTNCHKLGAHNPLDIHIDDRTEITEEFCGSCHPEIVARKKLGTHSPLDCNNCHNDFASWGVQFDVCANCHGTDIPTWHNETTKGCINCHNTSVIHTDPILFP